MTRQTTHVKNGYFMRLGVSKYENRKLRIVHIEMATPREQNFLQICESEQFVI